MKLFLKCFENKLRLNMDIDRTIQEMEQAANILMVSIDAVVLIPINLFFLFLRIRSKLRAIF